MQQFEENRQKREGRLIKVANNSNVNETEKQEKLESGNGKKNNCMDSSSKKLRRLLIRWPGHG